MAKTLPPSAVTFSDGFVLRRDYVVIATQVIALVEDDFEHSRIFMLAKGEWSHFDLDAIVRAVIFVKAPVPSIWCLGRDGRVNIQETVGDCSSSDERIEDAGIGENRLGYLHRIREISGKIFVCGCSGQIYHRKGSKWIHYDSVVGDDAPNLYSIDGTSEADMYAVGQSGTVFHHDGRGWVTLRLPTDQDFNWVRCVAKDQVYVCGNDGTFFRGFRGRWHDHSVYDLGEDFWCIEAFNGKIYLAADSGLHIFDGEKVMPIDTGLDPPPDGHRLHANDGVLWSFGIEQLAFFDGKKWELVKHPDNPDPGKAKSTLPRWKR